MKRFAVLSSVVLLSGAMLVSAKPRKGQAKEKQAAKSDLPSNLNLAAMRVHAIDVIYQLDLSKEQIKSLAEAGQGAEDAHDRTAAVGNAKLVSAFDDFYHAQLARKEDEELAKLRNQLAELVTDDQVQVDDQVQPTGKAWERVGAFEKQLTVGQIAAYVAFHADEVSDPAEKMVSLLAELHDTTNPTESQNQVEEATRTIGREVAGKDEVKASQVSGQVAQWIKDHRIISVDDLVNKKAELEASARKAVGEVPAIELLDHWVQGELAELISNPQLEEAIESVQANQEQSK